MIGVITLIVKHASRDGPIHCLRETEWRMAFHLSASSAIVALVMATTLAAQAGDEAAPRFRATELLAGTVIKGPHHSVGDAVTTDGFFHEFTITSDYGELHAVGLSQLTTRLNDVRALASLEEVSKTEVFMASAGGAVVNVGKSVGKVVTDPVDSAKGIGSGVKRLGVNLGRMTKRTVDAAGNDSTPAAAGDSAAEGAAHSALGVSGAMRRWARKVGADPYTTNPVLHEALESIGEVDAAGAIATKVVLPVPAVVATTADVGELVWGKDPEELRKINEQQLKTLGVPAADANAFFQNRGYTLTSQTRLAGALGQVKVPGAAEYVAAAARASGEREALFFVESAELLQRLHAAAPVTAVLSDSRALVARRGARAIVVLPLDYLRSTAETRQVMNEIDARARAELGARSIEAQITGRVSDRLRGEMKKMGWTLRDRIPPAR